jgi:hypothetical protein
MVDSPPPDAWLEESRRFHYFNTMSVRVAIINSFDKPLTAEADGTISWNRPQIQGWETFEMTPVGEGRFTFRGFHGKYLSAQADGTVECNRDGAQGWETFEFVSLGEGKLAIKTFHGHYLCVTPDGVTEARSEVSAWETFTCRVI